MKINYKYIKKNAWKVLLILIILLLIHIINFNIKHKNALKIINADIEVEKAKIESGK